KGNKVVKLNGIAPDRSCQPRIRSNKIIHIVPISSGCLGNCSYCIVKFARGKIVSFPKSNIIKDIQNALSEGCKEIWITAEDTAAYNFEGTTLDKLLKSITDIPMDFKIRVGMMTPNQALKISEGLIEVYKNDKIFKFLHVPVQSGSNEVLMNMNRYYKVEDFKYLISKFRLEISALSVSTDIICGFPGETKEQFNESLELIEWLKPDVLNISKFGLRPRTEAKNMKQIPGYEIKNRSVELTKRWKKISSDQNQTWINWEGEILIDEYGRNLTIVGRNFCYKTIVVDTSSKLGSIINVKVSESRQGYLKGIEISKP
ncbi:tRNA (N(6)-L-threonylcarbamoyladenosine(37)-C(2))-methylthiotransferase, partial [Candidatus Bathyarchaeota archaeon]|nr:tRNA (N(6)-L-threonylcarbamoyladenosine(37)-C(2))-methylthiotransferase [Candidatus Bathyarchaeota archaeon]